MSELSADVVVIGAGPCGAAMTWKLAQAGAEVLCLERGDWFDHATVSRDDPDYEARKRGDLNPNPNLRRWPGDDPVDDADSPIKPLIGTGVGGGSVWWSAHVPRFRSDDFDVRTRYGVAEDWPIGHDDLDPWYTENERMLGAAYVAGDPTGPRRRGNGAPLPPIGANGRRVAAAFDRLGWHWWPVDLVAGHGGAPCTHIGPCDIGCPARRRQSADALYMRQALDLGARLATGMRVQRLEHDAAGRVTKARCLGPQGPVSVRARVFVLCANGLGTPRLLLISASDRYPHGLANGSGLVGRNLMLHPYARVDALFDAPLGTMVPQELAGIVSFEFQPTVPERGFVRGVKLQLAPGPGPVALANGAVTGEPLPWGAGHHAAMEARYDRLCGMTVCAEDLPEPENRIALSGTVRDRDGLPAARMVYAVSENARRALDHGMARATEVLRAAGAVQTWDTPLRDQAGFHIMGTARMGTDSARSVVDPEGRCHDHANLFLADSSVFVTSSVCNPTATAQALALRSASRIVAQLGG